MAIRNRRFDKRRVQDPPCESHRKAGSRQADSQNHPPTGVTQRLFRTHRMISPNVAVQYSSRCASSQANNASCASFEVCR